MSYSDDYNPNHTFMNDEERQKHFDTIKRFIRVAGKALKEVNSIESKVRSEYDELIKDVTQTIAPFALFVDAHDEVKPLPQDPNGGTETTQPDEVL